MNPGGSVKDRAALFIVRDAIARRALKPGGTIVEGTAGNTGIGIALVANAMGFRTVIVIPETQSQEKKDMLRLQGAQLVEVPAVPYANPNNYVKVSGRLAERLATEDPAGAVWANQFDNVANRQAHIDTTGPEIFDELDGKVDGFICACGTGGTLAGVGMALMSRPLKVRALGVMPFFISSSVSFRKLQSSVSTSRLRYARLITKSTLSFLGMAGSSCSHSNYLVPSVSTFFGNSGWKFLCPAPHSPRALLDGAQGILKILVARKRA